MTARRSFLLSALAALAASACASPPAEAVGHLVDLQIVGRERGDALETWRGRGASWVAGRPGERYAVRLSNRSGGRVLVVLSVDGVNVVSGETAATGQTGYVLGPWQTTEITGWRKNWQEAAAFYFTSLPDSYAARTDRPDHVGVIGAAVFRERVTEARPVYPEAPVSQQRGESEPARAAAPASRSALPSSTAAESARADRSAVESKKAESLGTGHGEREYAPTSRTAFERATSSPAEIVQLRYDSWQNLRAAGIVPQPRRAFVPEPFPGFVADPRG